MEISVPEISPEANCRKRIELCYFSTSRIPAVKFSRGWNSASDDTEDRDNGELMADGIEQLHAK
jgi:hypothetical protein